MYNTEKSPEPDGVFAMENALVVPAGCAVLVPLKQIESEGIQYVKNLRASEDLMDFKNKYGCQQSPSTKIADILWLCSSMLSSSGKLFRVSQLMWFTDDDWPHKTGTNDFMQAFQKAKDLQQLRLDIQFFPMKPDFDDELFYKELLCQLLEEDPEDFQFPAVPYPIPDSILNKRLFRKGFKNRAVAHLLVELSDNAKFGVGVYSTTGKASIPKPVMIARDTNEQIISKRSYKYGTMSDDVEGVANLESEFDYTEKLEPAKTIKYQYCGGEKIKFTPLEAYEIKQIMDPKIKVLGFKPLIHVIINPLIHVKSPYFLYPNETRVKNSSVLFRTLWERCLNDEKVIICLFTMRLKSYPRLVALVPQEETAKDGEVLRFDGFRLEFIPFAEDVRDLSEVLADSPVVDGDLVSNMAKVMGRLRIHYSPSTFQNPAVAKVYAKIEEQVFDEEPEDDFVDTTMPKVEAQDERIEQFVDALEQLCGFDPDAAPKKRKATSENGESTAAKKKAPADIDMEVVLENCRKNSKSLTVPILKAYLENKDVKGLSKMNKAQLIAKVLELDN